VFRRRRESADHPDEDAFDVADDAAENDPVEDAPEDNTFEDYAVLPSRPNGPWDIADAPKDEADGRLDLGGIQIPISEDLEVRVDVQDDVPVAATLVIGPSQLQLHAFAAPKSAGIWAEIREEIATSLRDGGGSAQTAEGPFGTELVAQVPSEGGGRVPARFLGVDGPRWFLRGLVTGPAATDPGAAAMLEESFRGVVVNRGTDAMAPRDMIPLHLPQEVAEAAAAAESTAGGERRLELPERGPEITETR